MSEIVQTNGDEVSQDGGTLNHVGPKAPEAVVQPRWKLIVVLTGVCLVAGVALAGGHMLTHDRILKARHEFKLLSVKKVLPTCDNDPGGDHVEVALPGGGTLTAFRCRHGGKVAAVAYSLDSKKNKHSPYGGVIEVLVGVTRKGRIVTRKDGRVGVLILQHSETPGLGARIEGKKFRGNFMDAHHLGRNLTAQDMSCDQAGHCAKWVVRKDDPKGFVDAISGATISSRATTEVVHRALAYFNDQKVRQALLSTRPTASGAGGDARSVREVGR
ncbi:MAG: FMN-binding protein [Deltaproteobacteria bacterium]|nr:FMN-binding protein [Deltaproteobacteria bacterium]